MVEIHQVVEEEEKPLVEEVSASEERRLDAEAIEQVAATMERVSARLHLESLAKKLRKESEALARVGRFAASTSTTPPVATPPKSTSNPTTQPSPASSPPPAAAVAPVLSATTKYIPIDKFAFDAGGYNDAFVTLYIDLPNVGSLPKDQINCNFTQNSFDLTVSGLDQKSFRLVKDHLEKDIDPETSKIVIKKHKILVKLHKVKQGEYGGYEYWSKLTDQKAKATKDKSNPQASIMQMMKDMYEDGDDNMKKIIGETMMKQQRGELGDATKDMPGLDGDF